MSTPVPVPAASAPVPASPAAPTVISNMQALTDWLQPGNVGDTGGGDPAKPAGQFIMHPGKPASLPGTPAGPASFMADGAAVYNNGYWYRVVPGDWATATYFEYSLTTVFPTAQDLAACQAFEFELQQSLAGRIYNMAWQFDLRGSKLARTFDYNKTAWVGTGVPVTALNLAPGASNAVRARFLRQAGLLTHLSITLNGVEYPVNVTRPGTARASEPEYLHAAFQLDSASPAMPYLVQVSGMGLRVLATSG